MTKKKRAIFTQKPSWYKTRLDKILYLVILGLIILAVPGQNIYTVGAVGDKPVILPLPFAVPTPALYPVNTTGINPGPEITATGLVIYDINSGVYILKRNEEELLAPASTTKILTALVALDYYNLDDIITVKTVITDGQMMGLVPGERITAENLLFGTLIHYPGGVEKFVEAMNEKAKSLHLTKSTFTNPVGFDDVNHKMTPMDLARLGSIALNNKIIAKMVAIPQITVSDVTHTYFHSLKNVNELLGKIPGVGGIKTGWTEEAGENLMTLVERNGHRLILVVLRSKDRFGETVKLIDWVFSNYRWEDVNPTPTIPG
jgi:D-alanyl-D-alanine carboxypeptidase (penicillin-binding protein 5/6)